MDSKRVDMWFIPFPENEPVGNHRLEQRFDGSMYSSHIPELDLQSGPQYSQSKVIETDSPSTALPMSPMDVLVDEIWVPSERDSSCSFTQPVSKSQTSGRRRAQNRAAQRAFRERKEKRARDLEDQLANVSEKYRDLETEYHQLQEAYDKLQQTVELLTCDDEGNTSSEQLRRFLNIIQGKARSRVKPEVSRLT